MSHPVGRIDVVVQVSERDGFFEAIAKAIRVAETVHTFPAERMLNGGSSDVCASRDRNRAVSYALAELAAQIGGEQ